MSNRAAYGEKRIKKCGQASFVDRDVSFAFNTACNGRYEYHFSWVSMFAYLRQFFCILQFIIEDHAVGIACGFHTKIFSKRFTGPAPKSGEMYGMLSGHSFFQKNKGEHNKMKFETGLLRSCTDEDNDKNAKYGMRRSRPLTFSGLNAILTRRHGPLLSRTSTVIEEVYQMKSLSTVPDVSTSSALYLCPHGAERRGCT